MPFEEFWNSEYAARIKHPMPVRELLQAIGNDSNTLYDLTFYGAFAKKMLGIMKREGKDTQGFARMQQSFGEAVEKVRAVVAIATERGFRKGPSYTELSQAGMAQLLELIDDLSTLKDWQIHSTGTEGHGAPTSGS